MSKQSGFLVKQAAIQQKMIDDAQRITCELMAETLQITLHEEFGWGYDRLVKLDLLWRENYKHFLGAMNYKNPDADVLQVHLDRRLADVNKNRQPIDPFERRYQEIKPVTYNRKK